MIIWLILGILLIIGAISLEIIVLHESLEKVGIIIVSYMAFVLGFSLIIEYANSGPKAIDVYKGKTELRVTYEGNTPVDSVVVFKKIKKYGTRRMDMP